MIKTGQNGDVDDFVIVTTAGEALSARDAVYISTSDGKAYKCDADDATKIEFAGFAQEAAALNAAVNVVRDLMTGFSALTRGPYYLSATAGAVTATPPSSGHVVQVGRAVSATVIAVDISKTRFPLNQIFSGASPGSYTDLDLSSVVGSTRRVVLLKVVCGTTQSEFHFRRNGESGEHPSDSNDHGSGSAKTEKLSSGEIGYVVVPTDNAGIIEWASIQDGTPVASSTTTVTIEAYW